jgi:hypothetical protein
MIARRRILIIVPAILIALVVDRALVSLHTYYGRLLMEHECYPLPCKVDVNGDGASGEITVLQDRWLAQLPRFT